MLLGVLFNFSNSEKVDFENFCQCSCCFSDEWISRVPSSAVLDVLPMNTNFVRLFIIDVFKST